MRGADGALSESGAADTGFQLPQTSSNSRVCGTGRFCYTRSAYECVIMVLLGLDGCAHVLISV